MEKVGVDGTVDYAERIDVSLVAGFSYFKRDDVLMAKITPCFENGKGAHLKFLPTQCGFGSTEFFVLRPNTSSVLPSYLYLLTTLDAIQGDCRQKYDGDSRTAACAT